MTFQYLSDTIRIQGGVTMAFKDRIKEARLNNKLTQEQLAEKIGVAKSTLAGYEKGNREPNLETTIKIMTVLGIDANYLWQDEMDFPMKVSYEEMEHIEKYRDLDDFGQENVRYILDRETERVKQIEKLQNNTENPRVRIIQYYQHLASAGNGQVIFEDMPVDRIEIPDKPEYKRVSYAIGVNGNSMEPLYYDGDLLLIEPTYDISEGEIGIFIVGNEAYVKKLGKDELISLNRGYKNIPLTEESKCMGRVVDKLTV